MLKKSLMLLLCGASLSLCAQTIDVVPNFRENADRLLKGISQFPINSGILYSRVFPISDANYTPANLPPVIWNVEKFSQAVHELELASLTAPASLSGKKLDARYRPLSYAGELNILAFNTMVEELDSSHIIDSSLILQNGVLRFSPRPGKTSPFSSREQTAACIMTSHKLNTSTAYRIHFPANIRLGTSPRTISGARIRFGENEWLNIPPGGIISKTFNEAGPVKTEIEIIWNGNLVRRYAQILDIQTENDCQHPEFFRRPDECPDWYNNPQYAPSAPPVAIQADIPFQDIRGRGEVYYYLRNGNTSSPANPSFRNPIIFVDGIDFGDVRKGQVIYGKYLSYLAGQNATTSTSLGSQLRSDGHDLIILNFPDGRIPANVEAGSANTDIDGGSDFIERNAMTLIKLIRQVNQHLEPGSKKLSIVGPSMGGVIARYALAYMEKNSALTGQHLCGLFISQDSPHMGANIPVGLQQMINNLTNFNVAKAEQAREALDSPAASELLLIHYSRDGNQPHNELRTAYLQNISANSLPGSFGWPKDPGLRIVAIANGSDGGLLVKANDSPGSEITGGNVMLDFDLRLRKSVAAGLLLAYLHWGSGYHLITALVFAEGRMIWRSRYSPASGGSAETFRFSFEVPLLNQNLVFLQQSSNLQGIFSGVSPDASPGGIANNTELIADGIRSGISSGFSIIRTELNKADKYHSFVPLKSALAFHWNASSGLSNLQEILNQRNLVCTGETPFHAYYSPAENQSHVYLSSDAVNFLENQLNYSPPSGGTPYPAEISGPRAVPAGSLTEYSSSYQGNLIYRTSWNISEKSGIQATLTNPFSNVCKVLVSSGAGQENGYYILNLTTEVKSVNGDWICAGKKSQKINVRKIRFMGNIQVSCETNLKPGCYFKLLSGTPDYSTLTNGVSGTGYEWQISRYQDTEFGNSCWNNALSITAASTTGSNGEQKAFVNMSNQPAYGVGNVFTYYARVRNKMRVPNPDFGQPGEPQFLEIAGSWKTCQLQTTLLNIPTCPYCPTSVTINPDQPVKNLDNEVTLSLPSDMPRPATLRILDARDNMIREEVVYDAETTISIKEFMPGYYKIRIRSGEAEAITGFWLKPSTGTWLLASPSVVEKSVDKQIKFSVLDEHFLEEGNGSYDAELTNLQSGNTISWTGQLQEFKHLVSELDAGNYQLELNNGMRSISCNFDVLPSNRKPLQIVPNPAGAQIQVSIPGFDPQEGARVRILNTFGESKLETDWQGEVMNFDVSELQPGLYLMQVQSGNEFHGAWLQKE